MTSFVTIGLVIWGWIEFLGLIMDPLWDMVNLVQFISRVGNLGNSLSALQNLVNSGIWMTYDII